MMRKPNLRAKGSSSNRAGISRQSTTGDEQGKPKETLRNAGKRLIRRIAPQVMRKS